MSQITAKTISKEWVAFSTIETPVADTLYYIQNRGPSILVACEGDSEPSTSGGIYIPPYAVLKYKLGSQDLYLRAFSKKCAINVSKAG